MRNQIKTCLTVAAVLIATVALAGPLPSHADDNSLILLSHDRALELA